MALSMTAASLGWPEPAFSDETDCPAAVVLSGEEELVAEARTELAGLGIESDSPPECAAAHASLVREDGAIIVDVTDPVGRRSQRKVAKVKEAVSVIHSWTYPDLNADLLAGFSPQPLPEEPSVPEAPEPEKVEPDGESEAESTRHLLTASATGDFLIDWDGGLWAGAGAAACTPVSILCVGAGVRLAWSVTKTSRFGIDVLATVDWPLHVRRLILTPGIGLGAGRLATAAVTIDDSQGDETDSENNDVDDGDAQNVSDGPRVNWGFRAEAHVIFSYPVTSWMLADFVVAADFTPFAKEAKSQNPIYWAAEPIGYISASLGLRFGAP
jgi:hypothetical protein